ncbi:MAG: hypothetical protein HY712_05910 [candidate division NC10 bacterium]|nr:hypothetical protein [candidate division NC10 bacterium]
MLCTVLLLTPLPVEAILVGGLHVDDPAAGATIEAPTLIRQLSPLLIVGTPRTTEWLLDRPEIAASMARRLYPPLEPYQVTPTADGRFEVSDRESLRGTFRLVARGKDRRLYLCEGQFRSAEQFFQLGGRLALLVEYRERPARAGEPRLEVAPTLFVRLENVLAHGVFKLFSPLLSRLIDRRAANLAAATKILSRRITADPAGLFEEMRTWLNLRPSELEAYRLAFLPGAASP